MMVFAVLAIFLTSCEKQDIVLDLDLSSDRYEISVDKTNLTFETGELTKDIMVYSRLDWGCKTDADWASATHDEESGKITVQVKENLSSESRECMLVVYATNEPEIAKTVKIVQHTSLSIITCDVTELNFDSYKGSFNTLPIESNSEWVVKSIPDWLTTSVSSGNGDKKLLLSTISANESSSVRTGTVVVTSSDQEISVTVRQMNGLTADCQVIPNYITVLQDGIAFDMDYTHASNVAHYYRGYIEASQVGLLTNPEIIYTLTHDFQRHLPSDNEVADFSGLKSNTEYVIYTLAYDIEGNRGELIATNVKTRKVVTNEPCGWIENLEYANASWNWTITKSATCFSYWMMTTEDKTVAMASDVLQAWWIEDAVRRNKVTEYVNGGKWQQKCSGEIFAVWTLGKSMDGTVAGKISWEGRDKNGCCLTRGGSSTGILQKQTKSGDHSGQKLTDNQYTLYRLK